MSVFLAVLYCSFLTFKKKYTGMLQYKDLEDIITSCIPLWLFYFPDSLISLDFFFKKDFPDTVF